MHAVRTHLEVAKPLPWPFSQRARPGGHGEIERDAQAAAPLCCAVRATSVPGPQDQEHHLAKRSRRVGLAQLLYGA